MPKERPKKTARSRTIEGKGRGSKPSKEARPPKAPKKKEAPSREKAIVRLGPAGIPLSCKGRTTLEGVQHVHDLGLNAMEIEFVRGIRMDEEYALEVGELARALGVHLAVHAPYYTNLADTDEKVVEKSMDKIAMSGYFGDILKADLVVCHVGFYPNGNREASLRKAAESLTMLRDYFRDNKFHPSLGIEVMGKERTIGDLEEILQLVRWVPGVIPVIDFAHVHARTNGGLRSKEDFERVFDAVLGVGLDHIHAYFTGIRYANSHELHHIPIKKGDLDFNPLLEVILDRKLDVTIISNSPIVEHDAMHMRILLERALERRNVPLLDVFPLPAPPSPLPPPR